MRTISYRQKNFPSALRKLSRRAQPSADLEATVKGIVDAVRDRGDKALLELSEKFDKVKFRNGAALRVTDAELEAAAASVDTKTRRAIAASRKNVTAFAKKSLRKDWHGTNAQGAEVGEVYQPFERVGLYVPGGTAPLVSSANMTVALAAAAGCPEIVVCTPPGPGGVVNPALLFEKLIRQEGLVSIWELTDLLFLQQRGAPLDYNFPTSGTPIINDSIGLVKGSPHQAEARAFIDWVGSREALLLAAQEAFRLPARLDLPRDELPEWAREALEQIEPATVDWQLIAKEGNQWMSHWDRAVRGRG